MRWTILSLALALAPAAAPAQSETYQKVGWWDIVYSPENGGCAALTRFSGGVVFVIGLETAQGSVMLDVALLNENWGSIVAGREYEVTATFGRKGPWYLNMEGTQVDNFYGLEGIWPAESDSAGRFMDEFMGSLTMTWAYQSTELGEFSLKDSRRAFNAAVQCTEAYMGSGGTGSDPFAGSADPFGGSGSDPFQ